MESIKKFSSAHTVKCAMPSKNSDINDYREATGYRNRFRGVDALGLKSLKIRTQFSLAAIFDYSPTKTSSEMRMDEAKLAIAF